MNQHQHCPACGDPACPPSGKSKDLLIIGDFPGGLEMQTGNPWAVHDRFMTAGRVLRKELNDLGASLSDFRVIYTWLHEPNNNEGCWNAGYANALEEAKGKKAILLVGAETVETYTKFKVSDVSGLQVDSHILSAPIIYAMVNPGLALHRSVGETRLALTKFINRLQEEGLL